MRKLKNIEIFFILIAIAVIVAIAVLIWWALQKDSKNQPLWVAGLDFSEDNIIFSKDGINWTDADKPNFTAEVNDIAYGGKLWVAVGDAGISFGNIMYSSDGKKWTQTTTGEHFSLLGAGVAYGTSNNTDPLWVAVGEDRYGGFGSIMYSENGKNWTQTSSGDSFTIFGNGVAYGTSNNTDQLWVAVGEDIGGYGSIMYSKNGKNWTQTSSGDSFSVLGNNVAYGTSDGTCPLWVAVGNDGGGYGNIKYSSDGKIWTNTSIGDSFSVLGNNVAYGTSDGTCPLWVAVGNDGGGYGNIKYSSDGKTWTDSSGVSSENPFYGIAYGKTTNNTPQWIATGGTGSTEPVEIFNSYDGKVWEKSNYNGNGVGQTVAYEQELYGTNKSFYH